MLPAELSAADRLLAEACSGEVIDRSQNAQAPAACKRVHQKVERAAEVLILRNHHRHPRAERPFTAAALTHRHGNSLPP